MTLAGRAAIRERPLAAFHRSLQERAQRKRVPVYAFVELTYGCNLRCVHCYNPTHKARGEMTTAQVRSILDGLHGEGTAFVAFTGGELFTRRDWPEVLAHAKRLGMQITVSTNATRIMREVAERLARVNPLHVKVSLYGATRETYERVTGVRGSFRRFLAGVTRLRRRGVRVLLTSVILRENAHEIDAMRSLCARMGLPFQYSADIHPRVDGDRSPLRHRIDEATAHRIWRDCVAAPALRRGAFPLDPSGAPPTAPEDAPAGPDPCGGTAPAGPFACQCGRSRIVVTPYGKANLCLSVYAPGYDLLAGSVAEGWKALVSYVDHTPATDAHECPACPVSRFCERTSGASFLEMGDVNACVPNHKALATLRQAWHRDAWDRPGRDPRGGGRQGKDPA
ncbi:MAG: radical SAM protein [Planctomycetes bacterium]|nr:radical SAM protein [Planctomycetota bacterium]